MNFVLNFQPYFIFFLALVGFVSSCQTIGENKNFVFTREPQDLILDLNTDENVTFYCDSNMENAQFEWEWDGTRHFNDVMDDVFIRQEKKAILSIENLKFHLYGGFYVIHIQCTANVGFCGIRSNIARVYYNISSYDIGPYLPPVEKDRQYISSLENHKIVLNCSIREGYPTVNWYHNNILLTDEHHYDDGIFKKNDDDRTLAIPGDRTQAGFYHCRVRNRNDIQEMTFIVDIITTQGEELKENLINIKYIFYAEGIFHLYIYVFFILSIFIWYQMFVLEREREREIESHPKVVCTEV